MRDHSVCVSLASAAGKHGRNVLQPEYVEALSSSQIVVTCNPDGWEGDSRLGEALASEAAPAVHAQVQVLVLAIPGASRARCDDQRGAGDEQSGPHPEALLRSGIEQNMERERRART